ncbi:putative bifunctional diguanylate cyclase/phosphodiesterase [Chitinilyticum piscinae]|uniref:EAL domain-containing protein n=1 Tax=Chitinilyticum piscinae TaxID=2866724 RepID=A0A8J7KCN9_9NEIS|nr:bifunctional diguanylate cyclase/phosphodiesterase [Chitinilyticum piscinae]MBE9607944.1 EAL domain-containing protein [Chitinilyticum piscinae]
MHNELDISARLLDQLEASLIVLDPQGYITGWNSGATQLFGYTPEEILGQHILRLYADENEDDAELFNTVFASGRGTVEVRRRRKNGDIFWARIQLILVRNSSGQPERLIGFVHDISEQIASREHADLLSRVFLSTPDAIVITNPQRQIINVNPAYCRISGRSAQQAQGQTPGFLQHPELGHQIDAELQTTGHWEGELWELREDGTRYPVWLSLAAVSGKHGEVLNYFAVFSDLTERKAAEEQIHRLAYYDSLTSMPNRALLFTLLEQALAEARRQRNTGAVMCFNLVGFKAINDSFGHGGGDRLLVELSQRIRACLREEDVLARFGADEFYIGLFDIAHRDDAALVARRILERINEPIELEREEVMLKAHIGMTVYPDDGRDADRLINDAAVAMNRAKQADQPYLFYSAEMNRRSLARIKLATDLHHAIERNELRLYFQPQINPESGLISGAEALIRWQHPVRGLLSPGEFIPFAEENGLIGLVGNWVIEAACQQLAQWQQDGLHLPRLAVNLSARQFQPGLAERLLQVLRPYHIQPAQLELEITETLLMQVDERMTQMLQELHDAGFTLALDDFGTGYSNLAYLLAFPIDYLKIDQRFVRGLPYDANNVAIVRAIIGIAQNLGLELIAEGVETIEEARFLAGMDCDLLQGFYLARPLPAEEFTRLLRDGIAQPVN